MEIAVSYQERSKLRPETSRGGSNLVKSTSLVADKPTKNNNDDDDDDDDDEGSVRPYEKLFKSEENLISENSINTDNPMSKEEAQMEQEYEKILRSYLPFQLLNYLDNLDEEEADTMKTNITEIFCIIAIIDMSGLMDFINQLQRKGKKGSIYLKEKVNKYIGEMIDFIIEDKGDILNFTDQVMVVSWTINENDFFVDDCSRADLTCDAMKSCIKLLNRYGKMNFEFEDLKLEFETKIGLDAGINNVLFIEVEKDHLWQYINEGPVLNQAFSVFNYNTSGKLGISHNALRCIGTVIDIPSLNLGDYDKKCIVVDNLDGINRKVAELSEDSENNRKNEISLDLVDKIERYAKFVNDDLVYRFQACFYEIPKYHEELKLTTLIIKADEIPLETQDDLDLVQKIMGLTSKTLIKYEGILNNLYYEDNKLTVECVFGAPPFVHENDALYAVEAAIEIAGFLRRLLNACYYISVTTGLSWFTGLGNQNYGHFFQFGESIDYAYKIFNSPRSKYSILCDETTYLMTESYINFVNIGDLKYKNKESPVSKKLYVVINQKKSTSILPMTNEFNIDEYDKNDLNLIGKGYQWNLGVSILKKFVHSGKRRAMIIQGEEGYGISPFIKSFEKKAIEEGCSVCIGKIFDNTSLRPFSIFENLLREIVKVTVNEKKKQEFQRRQRYLESLVEEDEEDENNSSGPIKPKRVINNFKAIGKKSALRKTHGPRSALKKGKMKKSSSSNVSFDHSVKTGDDDGHEKEDEFKRGEKKRIKKRATFFDDQESIITSNTNLKNISGNSFEEDILEALFYLDEREEIAPLLNIIYYNRFETTNEVKIINKRMLFYELCNLICRLLTKLSFIIPLVIILDNAHMQDYFSWKLTNMIFKRCTKLFLCICTRPPSAYISPEIQSITKDIWNNLNTTVITLDNFSEWDTQNYLTVYYNEVKKLKYIKNKCTKINNDLSFNLWKVTEGNPLFLLRIANSLYDDSISKLESDGTLVLNKHFSELEVSKHCDNMNNLIKYQLSTLDSGFRNFLFVCALTNRHAFTINNINLFVEKFSSDNEICDSVYKFINQENINFANYDKYGFLKRYYKLKKDEKLEDIDDDSKMSSMTNLSVMTNIKCFTGNDDLPTGLDNSNYDLIFSFSGILIKNIIYEEASVDDRLELHELYAQYIEEKVGDDYFNIYYHYCNSNNSQKMIYYLSKVCHVMYKMGATYMATEAYELLLSYYDERIEGAVASKNNENVYILSRKTVKNPDEKIVANPKPCNYQLAQMFYELGSCYFSLLKYKNAELYFLKALDYLDYKFPGKNVSLVVKLIKETKKREQLNKLTTLERDVVRTEERSRIEKMIDQIEGEDREIVKADYKKSMDRGSLSLCQNTLMMIYQIYNIYHKSIHSQIALLLALNDPSSSENGLEYAEILARYGLELVWVVSTSAAGWLYLNAAENIINPHRTELPILRMTRSHLIVYDCLAIANVFLKSWSKGKHYVDIVIKLSQQTGDTEIWGRATILKSVLYFQTGAIDKSFRLVKEVYNNSSDRGIWKSQCTALLITLQYFGVKEAVDIIYTPLNVINIVFNLASKLNSNNNEDVVLYVGLILDVCFRFKVDVPDIFDYIKKVIPCLEKLEASSYYSIFAFPQYVIVLFLFYELGYFKKGDIRFDLSNQLLNSTVQAMSLFKETQIVQPLIAMLKGLSSLIQNNINNAIVTWEGGAKKAKRSQFYGAMLYWKIAYYGTGDIADRSNIIVRKLLEKICASFDLDVIKEWKADTFKITKARKG